MIYRSIIWFSFEHWYKPVASLEGRANWTSNNLCTWRNTESAQNLSLAIGVAFIELHSITQRIQAIAVPKSSHEQPRSCCDHKSFLKSLLELRVCVPDFINSCQSNQNPVICDMLLALANGFHIIALMALASAYNESVSLCTSQSIAYKKKTSVFITISHLLFTGD